MWQRLKKKSEADLRTLNEKEIQQKLYGHYFIPKASVGSDDISESKLSTLTTPRSASAPLLDRAVKTEPKIQTPPQSWESQSEDEPVHKPAEKSFSQFDFSSKTESARASENKVPFYAQAGIATPRKSAASQWRLAAFAIAGIFILGAVLYGVIHLKYRGATKTVSAPTSVESLIQTPSVVQPIEKRRLESREPVKPLSEISSHAVPVSVSKAEIEHPQKRLQGDVREVVISPVQPQKYYSIQICTYKQESDAHKLVTRLENAHMPAHYISAPGKASENSKFYLVLVGKDANYSDAEAHLSKFKQMPISHEFPDAYIRKNS